MTAEQAGLVPLATIRIATPFRRELLVASDGENIVGSDFVAVKRGAKTRPDPLLAEAQAQVQAYFQPAPRAIRPAPAVGRDPVLRGGLARGREPFVRPVRLVRRRCAGRGPAARAPRRRRGDGPLAARSVRSGASRGRRRRTGQGRHAGVDASAARRFRTREGAGDERSQELDANEKTSDGRRIDVRGCRLGLARFGVHRRVDPWDGRRSRQPPSDSGGKTESRLDVGDVLGDVGRARILLVRRRRPGYVRTFRASGAVPAVQRARRDRQSRFEYRDRYRAAAFHAPRNRPRRRARSIVSRSAKSTRRRVRRRQSRANAVGRPPGIRQ